MILVYVGAAFVGALVGAATFGLVGAILGSTIACMIASIYILNVE